MIALFNLLVAIMSTLMRAAAILFIVILVAAFSCYWNHYLTNKQEIDKQWELEAKEKKANKLRRKRGLHNYA